MPGTNRSGKYKSGLAITGFLGIGLLVGLAQNPIGSGSGSTLPGQSPGNPRNSISPDMDSPPSPFADSLGQKRNSERQRRIVSDTDRLLLLTNQLKTEAAALGSDTPTPEMLHQMDEIEKLARSVKDKMRN